MTISDYIKIPYKYNGRDFNGVDCYGLIVLYYKTELGITLLDYSGITSGYTDVVNSNLLIDNAYQEFVLVQTPRIHDVILIKKGSETPNHIGIYLGNGQFLHALESCGIIKSKLSTWKKAITGIYRYEGLA